MAELVIRVGQARSATFRQLLANLEQSQVIVYVDLRQEPRYPMSGRLQLVSEAGGVRWVSVIVDAGTSDIGRTQRAVFELTAILAHELQHALEVSQAERMADVVEFERHFRAIGVSGSDTLDTLAAREIGAAVQDELRGLTSNRVVGEPLRAGLDLRTGDAPAAATSETLRELMHQHFSDASGGRRTVALYEE